ncbi:MAG: anthranilate phosphoribosyltransferase [Dehalococcoidia bacterium]|tara:strand:+ start:11464 stop:12483 length:1020 start_codon:yes stop_codon:yes gene_type:complete
MIVGLIEKLVQKENLTFDESKSAMTLIMEGEATPSQFGSLITALRMKGETVDEVSGMASVMRSMSLHVQAEDDLIDTCGTGGDGFGTFNISTAAAFVAAGAGQKIAKHGNRAMSSKSGSADVLEALGVNIQLLPDQISKCIEETGFGFMFAQSFHPSMKYAAGPRREMGIRTVFNLLGPLTNPAGAARQIIGVADPLVGELMAKALGRLGSKKALVVHGDDGLDEITISTSSTVWELESGRVKKYQINPQDFGLSVSSLDQIKADNAVESASLIRTVLAGERSAARDIVLLNAGASLFVAGLSDKFDECISIGADAIDSGRAMKSLDDHIKLSNSIAVR